MTILKNTFSHNSTTKTFEVETEMALQFHSASRKTPSRWTVSTGNWALIEVDVKDEEALEGLPPLHQNDIILCLVNTKSTVQNGVLTTAITIEKLLKFAFKGKSI